MKKEIYKPYQIIILVLFSVTINFLGHIFSDAYHLPLWLDSFGTFLTAYAIGPVCGLVVGLTGNFLHAFFNPLSAIYAITSGFIGLIFGDLVKRGWMKNLFKTITLSVIITFASTLVSTILNIILSDGLTTNVWGDGIIALLEKWHVPFVMRCILGEFYLDFLDKLVTILFLYSVIYFYRMARPSLPAFLKKIPAKAPLLLTGFLLIFSGKEKVYALEADYNSYICTIYNNVNGLPGGEANDIASTNDGIIWVGTYAGLYRHNGHEFRHMNAFPSIKAVKCLFVDDEGRLFVGTNDNGLTIMINEEISNVIEEKDGLSSDSIRCIIRAANSYYYVGTSAGMSVLSLSDGLHIIKNIPEIENAIRVTSDSKNHIAAVTSEGSLYLLNGLEIIGSTKGGSELYTTAAFGPDGLLYAVTESNRLCVFSVLDPAPQNLQKGDFGGLNYTLSKVSELSCGNLQHIKSIKFEDDVIFLCADNGAGYIEGGVYNALETGAFNNSIDQMEVDYQGNLWFSSSRLGLLKMCKSSFADIYHSAGLQEAVVNSVNRFNGELYFGTDNGLSVIDKNTNRAGQNALTKYLDNVRIRCLMVDQTGAMWICSKTKGLLLVSPDGKITEFEQGHNMRVAIELSDGTIAAGGNDGIVFIKDKKIISRITEKEGLENSIILTLSENPDGSILAGTDGGGLVIIKDGLINRIMKKADGLSSNVILRTVNDCNRGSPTGGVFVVTSNGLCYLTNQDGVFTSEYLSNFPYSNNYDLLINRDNNIFVLGSAGIFVVNREQLVSKKKLDYEVLDLKKGLRGSLTANSWNYVDEEGNLYLSCDTGCSSLNLYNYDRTDHSYRIQLKNIIVDGKRHIVQKDIPFVIAEGVDSIEIVPEVINYSINNPYVSLYLEGVDESPVVMLQSELYDVIYTNLNSGTYKFHIGILDSKGIHTIEQNVYTIVKSYQIYENWWFVFYIVILSTLFIAWLTLFITSSIQERHIKKQQNELEAIKRQVRMGNETIFAIANAVEARDKRTGRHSFRVAQYSVMIAKELGFDDEQLENIRKIGLLHDIGKIGVPDNILNKNSPLTDKEYEIMKKHVVIGGEILKDFSIIENVEVGAKYHHERYDGSGYIEGLKGEEIPLIARIIGLADAFDAMTADRIYRHALPFDTVIAEVKKGSGTQFDPGLVSILLELIESGKLDVMEVLKESQRQDGEEKKDEE